VTGEDKTFSFAKCSKRIGQVSELPDINSLMIDVWSSPEVIEILLHLSETQSYHKVRKILDTPIASCPEYLLLALSQAKVCKGTYLLDELLSILMRGFLESHPQSSPVLKKLWDFNSELMIRTVSELCNDTRVNSKINISKALEITQGINDSLIRFVKSEDYYFAVSLGILAGDKDFLNCDAWLNERIKTVGSPFVRSLTHYLLCHVFRPIQDSLTRNKLSIRNGIQLDQQNLTEQEHAED
jgi:CCR4-NOT transcription complex subunit 1